MMQLLEDKVVALLELVESLKKENSCLKKEALTAGQEIAQLKKQVEMLESSVLNESHRLQELNKEKELTKSVVDDLIRNIEALVESGNQSQ
jgi:predicted nuclease with TOPRIM domain